MSPLYTPGKVVLAKQFTWNETVWNPSMITTALWLDATDASTVVESGGAVSQWNDKSGNSRNATQSISNSRPTLTSNAINGLPALTLDGSDDYMVVPHNAALNMQIANSTVIVVYKKSTGFRVMQKVGGAGSTVNGWFYDDGSQLGMTGFTTSYSTNQNAWLIETNTWNNSTIKHWRNGSKQTPTNVIGGTIVNGEIDPTATPTANTDDMWIGRRDNPSGTSGIMTGQIAAIILCNTELSDLDRQKVEGYYAHRLGLTANLPAGHPYKTVGPTP